LLTDDDCRLVRVEKAASSGAREAEGRRGKTEGEKDRQTGRHE
jgi:hypothetical protein